MRQFTTGKINGRTWKPWLAALSILCLLTLPAFAASVQVKKQQARTQFETAERMREELNGLPQRERSRREYQRVMDAYRRVYYTSPTSSKADASVVAVAELLAENGRAFNDEKSLRGAIAQYEFLRREYPGSKYRFDALFTIGQIYREDLEENDKARETFQEVIHRYPHLQLAADAREAIAEMDQQAHSKEASRTRSPSRKRQPQSRRNPALPKQSRRRRSPSRLPPTCRAARCRWSPESATGPRRTTPASPSILSRR
jgi:N-acetylmuramoyl-L-alanine amidase